MGSGKHSSDEAFEFDFSFLKKVKESVNFVKILVIFTVLFVVVGGIFVAKKFIEDKNSVPPETEPVAAVIPTLPDEHEGFEVLGKIKIDKIGIEQYILNSLDESALENGVIKLYGDELNDIGNFCIAGHNYENIFQKLNELENGDGFIIIDKNLEETEYEIKEIVSIEPDDLSVLLPNKDNIQITLITCDNIGTTRLVVKAEKKEELEVKDKEANIQDEVENKTENSEEDI